MVPPYSHRVSRVRRYSGFSWLLSVFAYETLTLFGGPSHVLLLTFSIPSAVRTPKVLLLSVWPLPRSLATTCGISVDFSSSPYLDVSVQAVPLTHLFDSVRHDGSLHPPDCSIQTSTDQCLFAAPRGFSQLITSFFGSQCQGIRPVPFVA